MTFTIKRGENGEIIFESKELNIIYFVLIVFSSLIFSILALFLVMGLIELIKDPVFILGSILKDLLRLIAITLLLLNIPFIGFISGYQGLRHLYEVINLTILPNKGLKVAVTNSFHFKTEIDEFETILPYDIASVLLKREIKKSTEGIPYTVWIIGIRGRSEDERIILTTKKWISAMFLAKYLPAALSVPLTDYTESEIVPVTREDVMKKI